MATSDPSEPVSTGELASGSGGAAPSGTAVPAWRRAARFAWLAFALVGGAVALAARRDQVGDTLGQLSPGVVAGAGAACLAGVAASFALWRTVLAGLGSGLPLRAAARVFFVGQLGKFLPGSVWPVVAQVDLARDFAVPPRASAAAFALFMWVHLATGVGVGAVALAASGGLPGAAALVALPVALTLLPGVLRRVLSWVLRLLRRAPLDAMPGSGHLLAAVSWALVMWAAWGLHLHWLLGGAGQRVSLLHSTGVFAAAWSAGFVVVPAPAGIGVREAVLVALLAPSGATAGAALAIAAVSRLLLTLADLIWGVVGLAAAPRRTRARTGAVGR